MKDWARPEVVFSQYEKGICHNQNLGFYETVRQNENFYNDRQWEGVSAPDLDKPVFNFLKEVANYYIAMIISDDIGVSFFDEKGSAGCEKLHSQVTQILEDADFRYKNRQALLDSVITGDGFMYAFYTPEGKVETELLYATDVFFGNPTICDVQKQPYIIISQQLSRPDVSALAKEAGIRDLDFLEFNSIHEGDGLVTVLTKFFREDGKVYYVKVAKGGRGSGGILKGVTCLETSRYPISHFAWERQRGTFHGQSPLTGKIQNQIYVNKMYAMAMQFTKNQAFPKLLYDASKISKWSDKPGEAVAVYGNPNDALFANFKPSDMSSQVLAMIHSTISETKSAMGAYEGALGNVTPNNTSAIIAVQKAAAMPLDMQRLNFYKFVEDSCRNICQILCYVNGFEMPENMKIEVGPSAYWSEIYQIQTLDNLYEKGIIRDATTYLESIPSGYVKNKAAILDDLKKMQDNAEQI